MSSSGEDEHCHPSDRNKSKSTNAASKLARKKSRKRRKDWQDDPRDQGEDLTCAPLPSSASRSERRAARADPEDRAFQAQLEAALRQSREEAQRGQGHHSQQGEGEEEIPAKDLRQEQGEVRKQRLQKHSTDGLMLFHACSYSSGSRLSVPSG